MGEKEDFGFIFNPIMFDGSITLEKPYHIRTGVMGNLWGGQISCI